MPIKYDFYQTEVKVVIDVLLKNAKEKNCEVKIDKDTVHLTADEVIEFPREDSKWKAILTCFFYPCRALI